MANPDQIIERAQNALKGASAMQIHEAYVDAYNESIWIINEAIRKNESLESARDKLIELFKQSQQAALDSLKD